MRLIMHPVMQSPRLPLAVACDTISLETVNMCKRAAQLMSG